MIKKVFRTTCLLLAVSFPLWLCGCFTLDFDKIGSRNRAWQNIIKFSALQLADPNYQPSESEKKIGYIDTSITQNFPSLDGVIAKPNPGYGLCTWHTDFIQPSFIENIKTVGWKKIYVGGGYGYDDMMTDDEMTGMVNLCNDTGAEIMYSLMGYARDDINPATGQPRFSTDEQFIQSYLDFIDAVVGRYGPGGTFFTDHPTLPVKPILKWEVWDEPSYLYRQPASWNDPVLSDFDHQALVLAKLLSATYNHLHGNPVWHNGGIKMLGISPVRDPEILTMVHTHVQELAAGTDHLEPSASTTPVGGGTYDTSNFYDIVSVHPYIFDGPPDADYVTDQWHHFGFANYFADIRAIMTSYGAGSKLLEATMGWHRDRGRFSAGSSPYPIPEMLQAAYVVRTYMIAMRCGLESFHIFRIIDADNYNAGFFDMEMGGDGYWHINKWWAQATAADTMIHLMPKPRLISAISDGVNGYYAYRINPDTDDAAAAPVIMVWNVDGPLDITLPCDPGDSYTVHSMTGYVSGPKTARSSSIPLKVGPYPQYVIIEKP